MITENTKNTLHIDNHIELPEMSRIVNGEVTDPLQYIEVAYWYEGDKEETLELIPLSVFQRWVEENDLLTVRYEEYSQAEDHLKHLETKLTFGQLMSTDWREYLISRVKEYMRLKLGDNMKLLASLNQYKAEVAELERTIETQKKLLAINAAMLEDKSEEGLRKLSEDLKREREKAIYEQVNGSVKKVDPINNLLGCSPGRSYPRKSA